MGGKGAEGKSRCNGGQKNNHNDQKKNKYLLFITIFRITFKFFSLVSKKSSLSQSNCLEPTQDGKIFTHVQTQRDGIFLWYSEVQLTNSLAATELFSISKPEHNTGAAVGLPSSSVYCTAACTAIIIFQHCPITERCYLETSSLRLQIHDIC